VDDALELSQQLKIWREGRVAMRTRPTSGTGGKRKWRLPAVLTCGGSNSVNNTGPKSGHCSRSALGSKGEWTRRHPGALARLRPLHDEGARQPRQAPPTGA